ncbi:MAG: hypothetical protein ACI9CU_002204 [Polaribacter sp.]|jgi:hypothetical protein
MGAIHTKRSHSHQTNNQSKKPKPMISNTFIFIFGVAMFGIWGIASYLELKKISEKPEDFR